MRRPVLLAALTAAVTASTALPRPSLAADASAPAIVVQAAAPAPKTITISSTAHVDYTPDLADLTFGVQSRAATAAAAAEKTNAAGDAVIAAMAKLGIPKQDLTTTSYNVEHVDATDPVTQASGGKLITPAHPAYYQVSTQVAVKAPVGKAGNAIDAALAAGANTSFGVRFSSSHLADYYTQALAEAMRDAHARATALAEAGGVTIDGLQSVTTNGDGPSTGPMAAPMPAMAARMMVAAPIASGSQSVEAGIEAVYSIK